VRITGTSLHPNSLRKGSVLQNVVPLAAAEPAPQREKRLVLRMLDLWRRFHQGDQMPQASALTAAEAGADADHVYMIDICHVAGPRFTYIGQALQVPGWPAASDALITECPQDSVLGLTSRHWREIVDREVPVTRGGIGRNRGEAVLYRSIMVPLIDESGRIAVIMGAANWRLVEEQSGTPIE
jgi:hypothetical protein